ncbi:MAG: ATP-binding cassette domain-containing protein [Coriobacteriales bacterium]|jgi:ABC-type transport system involved in cytochrome bd biosynthesis fused ATPase/permease subunit|nr:ATP-binding cassette domain-containing protein [Coriobacteriales bacterium]
MMVDSRMLAMIKGARRYVFCTAALQWAALLGYMGIISAIVYLLRQAFAGAVPDSVLLGILASIAVLLVARYICIRQSTYISYLSSLEAKGTLRDRLYRKMLDLGLAPDQKVRISEVLQMAGEGVEQIEAYFGRYLPQLLYSLLAPLTLFAFVASFSVLSALALLLGVPLILLSLMLISRRARRVFSHYWNSYTDLGTVFLESLQGLTTLKIFRADARRQEEMRSNAEGFRVVTMRLLKTQLASVTAIDLIACCSAVAGICVALFQFRSGAISLSGCLIIILLSSEFFAPLRSLASLFHVAMNGVTACNRMFALFDRKTPGTEGIPLQGTAFNIELRGLSYAYPERDEQAVGAAPAAPAATPADAAVSPDVASPPDAAAPAAPATVASAAAPAPAPATAARPILRDLTFSLPQGSFVALVGESGCGKSTLCALLNGARSGYAGSVTIAGHELRDVDRQSLLERVVLVGTSAHIFKASVAENLRVASAKASDEQLWEVLERVRLASFLRAEQGLETQVQEGAANLSGGQRQRLALARALLHDAPVYIFDEATSNIDAESEQCIMEAVFALAQTRTVLFISHRLANVVRAQCIHLLRDGRIVESGEHEELLARGGEYAAMYNRQWQLEHFAPERSLRDEAVLAYA